MPAREYGEGDVSVSAPDSYTIIEATETTTVYRIGHGRTYKSRHVKFDGTVANCRPTVAAISADVDARLAVIPEVERGRHKAHVLRVAKEFIKVWDGKFRAVVEADRCTACEKADTPCVVATIANSRTDHRAVSSCLNCHKSHGTSCTIQIGLSLGKRSRGVVRASTWNELGSTLSNLREEVSTTRSMTEADRKRWKSYVGRALFIVDSLKVKSEASPAKRPMDFSKYTGQGNYGETDRESSNGDDGEE